MIKDQNRTDGQCGQPTRRQRTAKHLCDFADDIVGQNQDRARCGQCHDGDDEKGFGKVNAITDVVDSGFPIVKENNDQDEGAGPNAENDLDFA